jgi:hypothetical protein
MRVLAAKQRLELRIVNRGDDGVVSAASAPRPAAALTQSLFMREPPARTGYAAAVAVPRATSPATRTEKHAKDASVQAAD